MLRFPFSIKTKFPSSPHTRVRTCVHAHKRFWSCNSAKQFRFRVYAFRLDLRFTVLRWPLCFNMCSGVCSCSEPSANFHPCCPRCILKFFSLCISWKPERGRSVYKINEYRPFPHPLFVLNTTFMLFNKTDWTSKCLYSLVREFYFHLWIEIYTLYQNNHLYWVCK